MYNTSILKKEIEKQSTYGVLVLLYAVSISIMKLDLHLVNNNYVFDEQNHVHNDSCLISSCGGLRDDKKNIILT